MEEIKKHMNKYDLGFFFAGAVFSGVSILAFIVGGPFGLLVLGGGVFMFYVGALQPITISKQLKEMEQNGSLPAVAADFRAAESAVQDTVRFGSRYVFCKGAMRILAYSEITRVYQYVLRQNGIETKRELIAVDTEGKTYTLCPMKLRKKSLADAGTLVGILLTHNPNIAVGYQK